MRLTAPTAISASNRRFFPGVLIATLSLHVAGCANTGTGRVKVIVGATLVTASAEIPDSVVVVDGKRIRAVGPRPTTPIPQDSERVDGIGRFVKAEPPVLELAAGQPADLTLLDRERKVERRMVGGAWRN